MVINMFIYIATFSIIIIIWLLMSYLKWRREVYEPLKKLSVITWIPYFGTQYIFMGVTREELFSYAISIVKRHSPLFCLWLGTDPEIAVTTPEHLEIIMNNSVHITKGNQYQKLLPWLGQGLLTSTGARWFQHRKLITPTFHFKILEHFMEVFVDKAEALLQILDTKANGKAFNVYPDITHCALDIICETAMGVQINAMSSMRNEYVESVYGISEIVVWRMLRPYITNFMFKFSSKSHEFKHHLDVLHGFTRKVIKERKQVLKSTEKNESKTEPDEGEVLGKKKRKSFLDMLLEVSNDGQVLSDQDIAEEVDTFMFEGHDTTTAGMCWTLFLLGNHPNIQERLYEEVSSVLGDKLTPTSIADLHELKYLECCVKESLRLYPSVPFIGRTLQQEITLDGHKIPAGVQTALHIYVVHRNSKYYPDPDKFDPDRFLPENCHGRHPYAYIPFSAGPRNCIGQKFAMYEEKTILAAIIKNFKITSMESEANIKITADLILRPLSGVIIKLERRKKIFDN